MRPLESSLAPPETLRVRSADGVELAVERNGPRHAPALVCVHGFGQSRQAFRSLLRSPLASAWHLIAYDVRGHGESDKPESSAMYAEPGRLANDLEAVRQGLQLRDMVLLGWSYGGVVIGDYLRCFRPQRVRAVLGAAAAFRVGRSARALYGPVMKEHLRGLASRDAAVFDAAARAFVHGSSVVPPGPGAMELLLRTLHKAAPTARRALLARDEDYRPELAQGTFPLWLVHGEADQVILPRLSFELALELPRTRLSLWPEVGHVPFLERRPAFERLLHELLRVATG